jgi:hypothetical protein
MSRDRYGGLLLPVRGQFMAAGLEAQSIVRQAHLATRKGVGPFGLAHKLVAMTWVRLAVTARPAEE